MTAVRGLAIVVSLIAVAVGVAATAVAAHSWLMTRGEHHDATGKGSEHAPGHALAETGEGRTRFMALAGVLASATFLLMIIVHAAAVLLVTPCAS